MKMINGRELKMQKEIRTELMTVGPELAKELLEKNGNNRNISQREVYKLVAEIKRGEYKFCPDPICFDKDGNLLNGQHRLTAIIKADMPVMCVMMFNVPRDAVIDRGRSRTAGEEAYMRGKIPEMLSKSAPVAVARRYLLMNTNFSSTVPDSVLTECLHLRNALLWPPFIRAAAIRYAKNRIVYGG